MADFTIIRGSTVLATAAATATLTNGVDYSLESGVDNSTCFARIVNTRSTGMGKTLLGDNQDEANFTTILSSNNPLSSFTIFRYASTGDTRVDWEIIQYTGPAGGANEIAVLQRAVGQTTGATITNSATSPDNDADCVPFITGQAVNVTGRNQWHGSMWTSDGVSGGQTTFTRGDTRSQAGVSWAMVEFKGSNWGVQTATFTLSAATATINSVDKSKSFLEVQYRYAADGTACGLDDAGSKVVMTNATTLTATSQTATDSTIKHHRCYIVTNTQLDTGEMVCNHYDITMAGTGEEEVHDYTISKILDTSATSILGETSDSTGSGTALPRGSINLYLNSITVVKLRQSDNGQTSQVAWQVVEWPTAPSAETPLFWGRAM